MAELVEDAKRMQSVSGDEPLPLADIHFYSSELFEFLQAEPSASLEFVVCFLEISRHTREAAVRLLQEMARVAAYVVVIDLTPQLAWSHTGLVLRGALLLEGPAMWAHTVRFRRGGGLKAVAAAAKLKTLSHEPLQGGALEMFYLSSFDSFHAARQHLLVREAGVD